jgi:hypothetical protein
MFFVLGLQTQNETQKPSVPSLQNRVFYNTINCGNIPDNAYYDEVPQACPGIISAGLDACRVKGPCWDTDALYVRAYFPFLAFAPPNCFFQTADVAELDVLVDLLAILCVLLLF